jgi:tetratricopeptide (TPR) repeat protein
MRAQAAGADPESGADTLQVLVWEAMRSRNDSRMAAAARDLLAADPDNALALAALASVDNTDRVLSLAKRGMRNADQLRRPAAMTEEEFARLKVDVLARLNGAAGKAYLAREDFVTARRYLNVAIALAPAHPQYVYAAALANLEGKTPRPEVGYRLLARAVHLTAGTPSGKEIDQFARQRYMAEGGRSEDWDAHLAAARPAGVSQPGAERTSAAAVSQGGEERTSSDTDSESGSDGGARVNKPEPTVAVEIGKWNPANTERAPEGNQPQARADQDSMPNDTRRPRPEPTTSRGSKRTDAGGSKPPAPPRPQGQEIEMAKNTPPKLFPELAEPMPAIEPGAPVSLGIVIQSSLGRQSKSMAMALSSLVRQMREEDEAFVISFSNGIVFEQDFTGNYRLLEQALESLEPQQGTALMESVAFAAVHLARVGRNNERVLLLISNGNGASPRQVDQRGLQNIEASGARIFCIGVGVESPAQRDWLTRLASATGGGAVFISGGSQFYAAADKVAEALKIATRTENGAHQ